MPSPSSELDVGEDDIGRSEDTDGLARAEDDGREGRESKSGEGPINGDCTRRVDRWFKGPDRGGLGSVGPPSEEG